MTTKLYVGGLPYGTNNEDLTELFEQCGTVLSASVIMDRDTGRSKGFGFVQMGSEAAAGDAIDKLNGHTLDGRNIMVNQARERSPRPQFLRN